MSSVIVENRPSSLVFCSFVSWDFCFWNLLVYKPVNKFQNACHQKCSMNNYQNFSCVNYKELNRKWVKFCPFNINVVTKRSEFTCSKPDKMVRSLQIVYELERPTFLLVLVHVFSANTKKHNKCLRLFNFSLWPNIRHTKFILTIISTKIKANTV